MKRSSIKRHEALAGVLMRIIEALGRFGSVVYRPRIQGFLG